MSMRRPARLFTTVALAAGLSVSAGAMVVVPAEFSEMVSESDIIVHGRVIDVQSYETAGRRTIESLVTVQVVEALKGGTAAAGPAERGRVVYFKLPGGEVGRYRRVMVGAPHCTRGDELVVFLKGRSPAVPMPFGLTQGLYRVSRDTAGRAMVMPTAALAGADRIVRGDPARRPLELTVFTTLIRSAAGARP